MEKISVGDVIASLALLLSAYATWVTSRFNNRQKKLIESQEKLNQILLQKEIAVAESERKADLGAAIVKLGTKHYRLRIWNKGRPAAKQVKLEFPEGNEIVLESELEEKFPLELLEQHQSVELIVRVHLGSRSKHCVKLIWSDEFTQHNEKTVYVTI